MSSHTKCLNYRYQKNQFYSFVKANIISSNNKLLADPTLIVQENESSSVGVGTTYTTSVNSSTTSNSVTSCEQVKRPAGLQLAVSVNRIDDNGFVTLEVSPSIKAPSGSSNLTCGGTTFKVFDLTIRELKTGRVRDGQTLILTGVIQDEVLEAVDKWPVLGDLPLIGQFFRKSNSNRKKKELVMVVTPSIINDAEGGTYGYGYQPSTKDARELIYQP